MDTSLVSIIIRTKNEEAWIGRCLDAIKEQTYKNHEIILVDTGSTDNTLKIVEDYDINTLIYSGKYIPGKVLNYGCRKAKGDYIVFISAHCLPVDNVWLENLVCGVFDPSIAGIYGKQEPMNETNPFDKRDLALTFGLDRRIQWQENFFHNANSIIKKKLWQQVPFDESLSNIEDRIWAANMQKLGYCIVYEPTARVFHYHGIHHTGCQIRCDGVNRIIDKLDYYVGKNIENKPQIKKKYIDAVIPFSIKLEVNKKISLYKKNLKNIIKNLKDSNQIRNIYLLTDSNILIDFVSEKEFDVIVPYLRSNDIDETLLGVMEDFISNTHFSNNVSFLIVYINSTDCDTNNTYEKLCDSYNLSDNSSAVVAKKNSGMFFKKSQGVFYKLDEQLGRYKGYKHPIYEVIESRGYIVHVNNLREGFLHKHDVLVIE